MRRAPPLAAAAPPPHQLSRPRQGHATRETGTGSVQSAGRPASPGEQAILALPEFETTAAAVAEDRRRYDRLGWVAPIKRPLGWTNIGPKLKLARDALVPHVCVPAIDPAALTALRDTLLAGTTGGKAQITLASSVCMRFIRLKVIGSLLDALVEYPDAELCHVTIVKNGWILTPEQLEAVTAATIKNQFFSDLKRTGVTGLAGPFVAFLHGEFDASNGVYILHFHVMTTRSKAAHMVKALRALKRAYRPGQLIKRPIRVSKIGNRPKQATYLLKGIWFQRSWRLVDGKLKRDRKGQRPNEPFHSLYLLWLDRHRLRDLTIMNGCWSPKSGGTAAMKQFYLVVMGVG
jgi:hypothetical protein